MQDIRIDESGEFRCWYCGAKNFDHKRTFKAKATFGGGALLTHKKLKCQACRKYNMVGNAQSFEANTVGRPVSIMDQLIDNNGRRVIAKIKALRGVK